EYLEWAKELLEYTNSNFWDEKDDGYFYTAAGQKNLIYRMKDDNDHSIPSGTAVMALNNLRFYSLTEDAGLVEKTEKIFRKFADKLESNPYGYGSYLQALDFYLQKPQEIVLVLPDGNSADKYYTSIFGKYFPNKVIVSINQKNESPLFTASLLQGKEPINGKTTIYVCHDFACSQPIFSIEEFEEYLQNNSELQ
ncbi:MAG: thioredoxin domain-containing protein, partial [Calditrichia bacterium]|nr:thioredoxin domain-containing protein [Calditrichia bacterium]